jgi:predicted RNase H-like nuclease (RuvC/YqgF family)
MQMLKRDDELSRLHAEIKRLTDELDQRSRDREQLERETSRLRDELRVNTDEVTFVCCCKTCALFAVSMCDSVYDLMYCNCDDD